MTMQQPLRVSSHVESDRFGLPHNLISLECSERLAATVRAQLAPPANYSLRGGPAQASKFSSAHCSGSAAALATPWRSRARTFRSCSITGARGHTACLFVVR